MENRGIQCGHCGHRITIPNDNKHDYRTCRCRYLLVRRVIDATNVFRVYQDRYMWRQISIEKRTPIFFDANNTPTNIKKSRWEDETTFRAADFPPDSVFIYIPHKPETLIGKQTTGYRSDEAGLPNKRKRYWTAFHPNGKDLVLFRWLAKIPRKIQEVRQLEYDERGYPVGKIHWKRARRNLHKAIARLELSYLDAVRLIQLNERVQTACWFFDGKTGQEGIYIHPILAQKSAVFVEFIIKHEVMHRALFRGMRDCKDEELRNIALDICVNNVLARNATGTRNKRMMTAMRWLYPPDTRKNILALTNGSLAQREVAELHPDMVKMWTELWGGFAIDGEFNSRTMPSLANLVPLSIYYRIRQIIANGNAGQQTIIDMDGEGVPSWGNPFAPGRGEDGKPNPDADKMRNPENDEISTRAGEAMEKQVKDNVLSGGKRPGLRRMTRYQRKFSQQASGLAKLAEWWDANMMSLDEINARQIEQLVKKMRTVHLIETTKARLLHHIRPKVRLDPYPMELTDDGVMYVAAGLRPPIFPFFENTESADARKRVTVYFDLSPSMADVLGHIPQILDVIEDKCDVEFVTGHRVNEKGGFVFAGSIKPIGEEELEKMRKGRVGIVGNSTCFDSVIEHAIDQVNTNQVDIILIVTDMQSAVSEKNIIDFNKTGKKCFTMGLVEEGTVWAKDAQKTLERSHLTKLNGECTILDLPKYEGD